MSNAQVLNYSTDRALGSGGQGSSHAPSSCCCDVVEAITKPRQYDRLIKRMCLKEGIIVVFIVARFLFRFQLSLNADTEQEEREREREKKEET